MEHLSNHKIPFSSSLTNLRAKNKNQIHLLTLDNSAKQNQTSAIVTNSSLHKVQSSGNFRISKNLLGRKNLYGHTFKITQNTFNKEKNSVQSGKNILLKQHQNDVKPRSQQPFSIKKQVKRQSGEKISNYEFSDNVQKIKVMPYPEKLDESKQIKKQQSTKKSIKKVHTSKVKKDVEPQICSQDTETEYIDEATPGPGQYNIQAPKKQCFRSKKQKFQSIFYSKLERFQQKVIQQSQHQQSKQQQSVVNQQKSKKGFFFSKLPKVQNPKIEQTPSPGYYNTRQTLQHDLIRNILKSSSSVTFVSGLPRSPFSSLNKASPGPGSYDVNSDISKLQEEANQPSHFFKSNIPRELSYLKNTQISCPANMPSLGIAKSKDFGQIHVKNDSILEKQNYFESPPFMSSEERFPSPKKMIERRPQLKPSRPMNSSQNKAPFNSSAQRDFNLASGDGVGVGIYGSPDIKLFGKKTFNINVNSF